MPRVLVLGGYGVFGSRAAERLLRDSSIEVVIAGRSKTQAALATERFATELKHRISSAQLDATLLSADDLRRLGVSVVINTVGPYQAQNYRVAEAAIAAGVHYVDLADARAFVTGIRALDAAAKRAGVLVVSGASTVPALAASVIDDLLPRFKSIDALTYGISPGNSFDPGAEPERTMNGRLQSFDDSGGYLGLRSADPLPHPLAARWQPGCRTRRCCRQSRRSP